MVTLGGPMLARISLSACFLNCTMNWSAFCSVASLKGQISGLVSPATKSRTNASNEPENCGDELELAECGSAWSTSSCMLRGPFNKGEEMNEYTDHSSGRARFEGTTRSPGATFQN
jgi:hypothetical protein